jgi:hypothetical protein
MFVVSVLTVFRKRSRILLWGNRYMSKQVTFKMVLSSAIYGSILGLVLNLMFDAPGYASVVFAWMIADFSLIIELLKQD